MLSLADQLTCAAALFLVDKVHKILVVLLFEQCRKIPRRQTDMVGHVLQHNALVHIVPHILAGLFQQGGATGGVVLAKPGRQGRADLFQPCQHLGAGGQKLNAVLAAIGFVVQQRGHGAVNHAAKPKCLALLVGDGAYPLDGAIQQQFARGGVFGAYLGGQAIAQSAQRQRVPRNGRELPVKHGIAVHIIVIVAQAEYLAAALVQVFRPGKAVCAQHGNAGVGNGLAGRGRFLGKSAQPGMPCSGIFQLPAQQKQRLALGRRISRKKCMAGKVAVRHALAQFLHPGKQFGTLGLGAGFPGGAGKIQRQIRDSIVIQHAVFGQDISRFGVGNAGLGLHQA